MNLDIVENVESQQMFRERSLCQSRSQSQLREAISRVLYNFQSQGYESSELQPCCNQSENCHGVERSRYIACLPAVRTFHSIPRPFFSCSRKYFPESRYSKNSKSAPFKWTSSVRVMKRKNRTTVTIGRSTLTCIFLYFARSVIKLS